MEMDSPTGSSRNCCIRMKLLALLILVVSTVFVLGAITANFISDPRSLFPKVARTKNAHHFLQFYMGTFRQMFRNKTEVIHHFNYYDDDVKAEECYIDGELNYTQLRTLFERYTLTQFDPKIQILYAVMNKNATLMTAEFHVTTTTRLRLEHHFHMRINAFNDDTVGWGVQHLNMAFNC